MPATRFLPAAALSFGKENFQAIHSGAVPMNKPDLNTRAPGRGRIYG